MEMFVRDALGRGLVFAEEIKLLPHSLSYFVVRAGNGALAIATLATFTRLLSPAEYGVYALGMATANMASAILFQWLNVAVGRFYPMHLDDPGKIMVVAARGYWAASGAAAMLFLGALPFHEMFNVDPALFGILFLITVALGRHTLALQVANAQSAPVRYGMLSWAKSGGALLAGFICIRYGAGERGALLGFLVGLVFAVIIFTPKPRMWMKSGTVDKTLSLDMLRYGLPLTLNFLAIAVVDLADRFMIGNLLGPEHVAPYAVAYDLAQQTIGPVMNVLYLAAIPTIVYVVQAEGEESARVCLRTLGSHLIFFGLPVAVGFGVLASDISDHIFGRDYHQDTASLMPWLAAAIYVGTFKLCFLDVAFQLRHKSKYQSYIAMLMAASNIILNLFLLPRFGVIAAAWVTFAVFFVGALASWYAGRSIFSLPAMGKVFWGCAAASAAMAAVLCLLPSSDGVIWLLAKFLVGLAIYSAMVYLFNVSGYRSALNAFVHQHVK